MIRVLNFVKNRWLKQAVFCRQNALRHKFYSIKYFQYMTVHLTWPHDKSSFLLMCSTIELLHSKWNLFCPGIYSVYSEITRFGDLFQLYYSSTRSARINCIRFWIQNYSTKVNVSSKLSSGGLCLYYNSLYTCSRQQCKRSIRALTK